MRYKGYTGTSEYSAEDCCYHGQIAFIRDLITYEGESLKELETAFKEAVERYLEYCEETGKAANAPVRDFDKLKRQQDYYGRLKRSGITKPRKHGE